MKTKQIIHYVLALIVALSFVAFAGDPKEIRFGVSPGPYGDLITKAIKPGLEKKGYTVSLVQFQDYVQPDLALAHGETEANLFQHQPYLEKFAADHNLTLSPVIRVPTAALGIFSHKIKSFKELKKGDEVTIAQDPTNLARALRFLQKVGLIKLKADIDAAKASEKDIAENPIGLKITPLEAAQIPRSLESVALAVVNGNYAIAAGLRLSDALIGEDLQDNLKVLVAVRTDDVNKQFVKDIKEVVESKDFYKAIENPKDVFNSFAKPDWYTQKWAKQLKKK